MMNNALKYILIFAMGTGVGYLVTKKMLEEEYSKLAQEEIDSVKETLGRSSKQLRILPTPQEEPIASKTNLASKSSLDGTYTNKYDKIKQDYRLAYHDENGPLYKKVDEDDEEEVEDLDTEAAYTGENEVEDGDEEFPFVIDEEQFAEEMPHYDKITLYYYRLDDTLCEENEEPIPDVEDTIGYDAIRELGLQSSVLVRNDRLGIDYEIVCLNQSYQEQFLGIREANAQRKRRNNKERNGGNDQ